MPIRYNITSQYLQPQGGESKSIVPGEGFDFTEEEAATLGIEWSETNPHEGLDAEKAWKAKRDNKTKTEVPPAPETPEPGDTKEN